MATVAKTEAPASSDVAELGANLARVEARQRAFEARLAGLLEDREEIVAQAESWVTQEDLVYVAGGATIGAGTVYIGSTQGWWELNALNMGIGVVGGGTAGYLTRRLLKKN